MYLNVIVLGQILMIFIEIIIKDSTLITNIKKIKNMTKVKS